MLLGSFFELCGEEGGQDSPVFRIRLHPGHEIFRVHFPGKPVVPGVCLIQIVTELLARHLGCEVYLSDIKNVKYMAAISPEEGTELDVQCQHISVENDSCKVSAAVSRGERMFSQMSMTYQVARNHSKE